MEFLVGRTLVLQDFDCLLLRRLLDGDFLEECRELLVFLNILGISVDGRSADDLNLILGQELLEVGEDAVQYRLLILDAVEVLDDEHRLEQV